MFQLGPGLASTTTFSPIFRKSCKLCEGLALLDNAGFFPACKKCDYYINAVKDWKEEPKP